jgi:hypothetical protein
MRAQPTTEAAQGAIDSIEDNKKRQDLLKNNQKTVKHNTKPLKSTGTDRQGGRNK